MVPREPPSPALDNLPVSLASRANESPFGRRRMRSDVARRLLLRGEQLWRLGLEHVEEERRGEADDV
jgi:hypothetical protein